MISKTYLNTARRVAQILLEARAVTISPSNPFRYVSGILSPIYTDNRILMGHPLRRKEITVYLADLIKESGLEPEVIAGTATAGIPPAAWLSELLVLPMIYVRSSKKAHGKGKQIEGVLKKGANVLLIEDLISTGKSSLTAVDAIREEGGKVNTCLAFFTYGFKDSVKAYKDKKVNLLTLTSFESLVDVAEKMNLIQNKEKDLVLDWKKDPWGWEKKVSKRKENPTEY